MEEWFTSGACDGFVLAATHCPGAYEDVVRLVVPELQRRGVFRDRYTGHTLRENLGLERPESTLVLTIRPRPRRQRCTNPGPDDRSWRRRPAARACARRPPSSGADLVFLDLEDACAPIAKEAARATVGRRAHRAWTGAAPSAPCGSTASTRPGATATSSRSSPARATRSTCSSCRRRGPARDVWWVDVLLTQLETKLGLAAPDRARGADRGGRGAHQRGRDRQGQRPARGDHLRRRRPVGLAAGPGRRQLRPGRRVPRRLLALRPRRRCSPPRAARASTPSTRRTPRTRTRTATGAPATHASLLGFDGKWAIHPEPDRDRQRGVRADRGRDRRRRTRPSRSTGRRRPTASARSGATASSSTPPTCAWPRTCSTRRRWRRRRVDRRRRVGRRRLVETTFPKRKVPCYSSPWPNFGRTTASEDQP